MKIRAVALLLIATTISGARSALAQAQQIAPRASVVFTASTAAPAATTPSTGILGDGSQDYRYTGMWVGVGTALALSFVSYEFCRGSDGGCDASAGRVVLGTLLMTAVTGTIGALVGAQFDK
jgi:hypothetical protein